MPDTLATMLKDDAPRLSDAPARPDRRRFLETLGGGIVVLLSLGDDAAAQESGRTGGHRNAEENLPENIGAWLHIAPDGTITVFTGKAEMGQNIRTSLTQAVADELRCDPTSVRLVMADTALTPFDRGTFGSRTTPTMAPVLRKAAAKTRELLVDAAAEKWGVDGNSIKLAGATVTNGAGKSLSLGELARSVDLVKTVYADAQATPASNWSVAGKPLTKLNARDMVTGRHRYSADVKSKNLVCGRVLRQPSFGATLVSVNTDAAARMSGVTVVRDKDFVGITAPDEHSAQKAIDSIRAEWKQNPQISTPELFSYLKANPESPALAGEGETQGSSLEEALEAAHKKLKATYTVSYIAHVPLEPRAAMAEWKGGKLTVWTGSQRPFGVRSELAQAFGIPEEQVRVIVPDTGSAYGGKHTGECAIEAARLAKQAGKPVQTFVDSRGRIHVGLFSAGGRDRDRRWHRQRWNHQCLGVS